MTSLTKTKQFNTGKKVERFLDEFFRGHGFTIVTLSSYAERVLHLGDRKFTKDGQEFFVEYKSGIQTRYTGNIFLETISVDVTDTPGWVYTCRADFIFYAALLNQKILVFRPSKLRAEIEGLRASFPEVKTAHQQNQGYNTHGVLVPLDYAEANLAESIIETPEFSG